MTELREFVCKKCGHTVVVNPKLPADYTPSICTPCWEADAPLREAADRKLMAALGDFLDVVNKNFVIETDDGEIGIMDYARRQDRP